MKVLKTTVHKNHKVDLEDLSVKFRDLNDDFQGTKLKVNAMEEALPSLVREQIKIYIE